MLFGCALPPNTALRDWARLASVLADQPRVAAPAAAMSDGLVAQQEALAIYLYALSVLAQEESLLTFRSEAFAPLVPRAAAADPDAGSAVAEIGRLLAAARAGNPEPGARAYSVGSQTVIEDLRLPPLIRAADAPVQVLVRTLSRATSALAGPGPEAYRRVLVAIGEGHALLKASASHIRQREVEREMHAQEDHLRRLTLILAPDPAVGLRTDPAGIVGAVVHP